LINDTPSLLEHTDFTSSSNPVGDQWRVDQNGIVWGNSLHPDFTLPLSSDATAFADNGQGNLAGMLYDVRRSTALIDQTNPDAYFRSVKSMSGVSATQLDQTIDMGSVMSYPPPGGWSTYPGAELPAEGLWFLQYKAFTDGGWAESFTNYVRFGLDLTPPTAPSGLAASPTTDTALAPVTGGSRIHVTWLTGSYDELSGVAYYQVLLDGANIVPDGGDSSGRVVDIAGRAEPAVTIENLTVGKHTIGVEAVDRAGNVSKPATVVAYSDPDAPTISITSPSGSLIGVKPTISATAADQGGVASVVFRLDGDVIGSDAAAPYSITPDLSPYLAGPHVLTATVTDRYGRQVTATKNVSLDKTALTISSVTSSCSKRKLTIKFNVSRAANVKVSLGVVGASKTLASSSAAKFTYTYTYPKTSSRYPSPLSFTENYTISATDALGNAITSKGKITIKIAHIVRVSGSKVKIVYY
jgi:hypothetical protein